MSRKVPPKCPPSGTLCPSRGTLLHYNARVYRPVARIEIIDSFIQPSRWGDNIAGNLSFLFWSGVGGRQFRSQGGIRGGVSLGLALGSAGIWRLACRRAGPEPRNPDADGRVILLPNASSRRLDCR
jgi:hypothetical protein